MPGSTTVLHQLASLSIKIVDPEAISWDPIRNRTACTTKPLHTDPFQGLWVSQFHILGSEISNMQTSPIDFN